MPDAVRAEVKARTRGRCQLCLYRLGYRPPYALLSASGHGAKRIAHLHHCLPVDTFPELTGDAANLIGLCVDCHFGHEYPGVRPTRIPRDALLAETLELMADDGPRSVYMERTYPLADAGRLPAETEEPTHG